MASDRTKLLINASMRNTVVLTVNGDGQALTLELKPDELAKVVLKMLAESQRAMKLAGVQPVASNKDAGKIVGLIPSGLQLAHDIDRVTLVVQAGATRLGIAINDPAQLAQALLAASASTASPQ